MIALLIRDFIFGFIYDTLHLPPVETSSTHVELGEFCEFKQDGFKCNYELLSLF